MQQAKHGEGVETRQVLSSTRAPTKCRMRDRTWVRAANKHRYALADQGLLTSSTCQMNGKSRLRALVARARSLLASGFGLSSLILSFLRIFGVIFVIFVISLDVSKPGRPSKISSWHVHDELPQVKVQTERPPMVAG